MTHARNDVCEYMDAFVLSDVKQVEEEQTERTFPNDDWILDELAGYAPDNIRLTKKALEDWQSRNILRREQPRGRWRLDDVAALFIMRVVNTTHQKGWLPEEIPEDEPRWWCFGKASPDAPVQSVPLPLQGCDVPLLLWTSKIGASWEGNWQRTHGITACWSRPFTDADEVAVWHTIYAQEIEQSAQRSAQVSTTELRFSQDGELLSRETVQTALRSAIQEAIQKVQQVMLREAEQLILEEQARIISKEK